jgi:predicted kinase
MQSDQARQRELQVLARQYLAMATGLLEPCQPLLFAVGGLSGTGKSSVAARLAPDVGCAPGAVVLRSDEIRKELSGVTPLTRLGPESYSASVSARVYGTLLERARRVLQAGHCVIVDATYARLDDRLAIERVAKEANAPFAGVWLEAPADVLVSRVAHRHDDPSDADARVVQMQLAAPFGVMTWAPVDATLPLDVVVERARLQLPSAQASAISNHR